MAEGRLREILSFLETIDKLKSIHRATYLTDNSRNEDDAAHTWHRRMYAMFFHKELDAEQKQNDQFGNINKEAMLRLLREGPERMMGLVMGLTKEIRNF